MAAELPFEIWSHITSISCYRDQSTRYSLLRSSKYLKSVVDDSPPDAISIQGLHQLLSFADYLDSHRSWAVRHLHLSTESSEGSKSWYIAGWPGFPVYAQSSHKDAEIAMRRILFKVAPTLQSLCVYDMATTSFFPQDCEFPILKDLIVVCKSFEMTRLPALERLHFASGEEIREYPLTARMAECTPNLLEMRTSDHGLHKTEASLMYMECRHLRRLLIRSPPSRHGPECWTCNERHCVNRFAKVVLDNVEGDNSKRIFVMPHLVVSAGMKLSSGLYNGSDAKRDWINALDGGSGSWCKYWSYRRTDVSTRGVGRASCKNLQE